MLPKMSDKKKSLVIEDTLELKALCQLLLAAKDSSQNCHVLFYHTGAREQWEKLFTDQLNDILKEHKDDKPIYLLIRDAESSGLHVIAAVIDRKNKVIKFHNPEYQAKYKDLPVGGANQHIIRFFKEHPSFKEFDITNDLARQQLPSEIDCIAWSVSAIKHWEEVGIDVPIKSANHYYSKEEWALMSLEFKKITLEDSGLSENETQQLLTEDATPGWIEDNLQKQIIQIDTEMSLKKTDFTMSKWSPTNKEISKDPIFKKMLDYMNKQSGLEKKAASTKNPTAAELNQSMQQSVFKKESEDSSPQPKKKPKSIRHYRST